MHTADQGRLPSYRAWAEREGEASMEIYMTIGARYLPRGGPLGVAGGIWPKRPLSAPSGALRLRAGLPFDPALISPTRIDLPVTDRMLVSAEP